MRALLHLGEETSVVEGERDPACELHRHRPVGLVEARLASDGAQADRAERPPAGRERRNDAGGVRDRSDRARVLGVMGHCGGLRLEIGQQLGLARPQRDLDRMRRERRRIARA